MRKLIYIFTIVLFALTGCEPAPTPVPTSMPTVTPTLFSAPMPANTPAATDVSTSAPTPTFPLGVGLWDESLIDFFNQEMGENDVIAARLPIIDLLDQAKVGRKIVVAGGGISQIDERVERLFQQLSAKGVEFFGLNLEADLPKEELVAEEAAVYQLAQEYNVTYVFGPTLPNLERYYADFAKHADVLVLQSQRYQGREDYEEAVEDLIARIKKANPDIEVWVQVSVLPPPNREMSVDEVIRHVNLIADKADLIFLYYTPQTQNRLKEVIEEFR